MRQFGIRQPLIDGCPFSTVSVSPSSAITRLMKSCRSLFGLGSGYSNTITSPRAGGRLLKSRKFVYGIAGP